MPSLSPSKWLQHLVASQVRDGLTSPHGDLMPSFPPEELQRNTTSLSGDAALGQAAGFYEDIILAIEGDGSVILPAWKILDFGASWGRIARFFLRDVSLRNLYGLDVDPGFVELARSLFGSDNFKVCGVLPPAPFADASFGLISAYSVFSHLSERSFLLWMEEFARILRRDAYLAFTTRHESFLDYCAWIASQGEALQGYLRALGGLFTDVEQARRRYRAGEFVFATSPGVSGGGVRNESFYGEAFVPRAYVERSLARHFRLIRYSFDPAKYDQAGFVLRRL